MSSPDPSKKLRQLRLPFAPVNKCELSQKKRKISGNEEALPESKILRTEGEVKTDEGVLQDCISSSCPSPPLEPLEKMEDLSSSSSSSCSLDSPSLKEEAEETGGEKGRLTPSVERVLKEGTLRRKGLKKEGSSTPTRSSSATPTPLCVSVIIGDGENPISELDTPSIKDKKRKIRVEIGRLSIQITDSKDAMDQAVEKQDFLLAQQHKIKFESLTTRRNDLQIKLDSNIHNLKVLQAIVDEINSHKSTEKSAMDDTPEKSLDSTPSRKRRLTDDSKSKKKEDERFKKELERLQKESEKLEKQRKKDEEKLEKERKRDEERLEKERKREEERIEKDRKREEERVEKEKKREEDKLEKERKKELERLEKERKKNEEKLEKLKQEELDKKKREKTVQSFASFFLKKDKHGVEESHRSGSDFLNSFQIKNHMRLAPVSRSKFDEERKNKFEKLFYSTPSEDSPLYLNILRSSDYVKSACDKTWNLDPKDEGDDDVEIIDEEDVLNEISGTVTSDEESRKPKQRLKAKLLHFHENQRPPYWGTWTKKTSFISGRRPFAMDKHFFEYDYDSDDDWEEEEQGESLSDDDDDKDKEEEEEDAQEEEDDDGFFVGHGVLDKEEILHEEEEDGECEEGGYNEDLEIMKQKLKAQAFEEEYKRKKPMKLKPKVFGCLWIGDDSTQAFAAEQLTRILSPMSAVILGSGVIQTSLSASMYSPMNESTNGTPGVNLLDSDPTPNRKGGFKSIPEEAICNLVRLVHANSHNKPFMAKEFAAYLENSHSSTERGNSTPVKQSFSKRRIIDKIGEIAEYRKVPELNRKAWMVKEEFLSKYMPKDSPIEIPNNSWIYNLEQPSGGNNKVHNNATPKPTTVTKAILSEQQNECLTPNVSAVSTSKCLITNFVKVLTPEERERQMKSRIQSTPNNPPPAVPRKRVALISLGKLNNSNKKEENI
uniref:Chromatin assembly factor 1 subunit Alike [Nasonia vitripennis] n=1 Tax=Lepeophtheirus salmonis TaxID=72036 RepID=A0A0K2UQJ2_LEPSM